jgi:TatD DNase family protein
MQGEWMVKSESCMKFVDAHIHLSDDEYSACVDEIVAEAKNAKVVALVSNSMDLKTSIKSLELTERYSGMVRAALGIHPWAVKNLTDDEFQQTLDLIKRHSQNKSLMAIGEIGLDFKYMDIWDKQMKVFDSMLRTAEELKLPVIIHSRGTTVQIVDMLPSYNVNKVLLHWFSNPISALSKAVEKGYYISEGAPTVYSNGIRDVVKKVPIENLLTETDGPVRFYRPPFQGKRTTPAFIPTIVNAIAELQKMTPEKVAEHVAKNFEDFFGIRLSLTG